MVNSTDTPIGLGETDVPLLVPQFVRVTVVTTVSVAIVLTNVINLVVLRLTRQMPNIAKICLINLSCADLTVGIVSLLPCVVPAVTGQWPYGPVWCQFAGVCHGACCSVSIWSLSVISVDRYLAIKKPLRYHNLMTRRRCYIALSLIWTFMFGTFLLPILISPDFTYYQFDSATVICGLYWEFPWLCIATGVYIPIASGSIILYTIIGIIRETRPLTRNMIAPHGTEMVSRNTDKKALRILSVTAVAYFTVWGPYVISVFLVVFVQDIQMPVGLNFTLLWLANSNSFMNVIIYSAVYESFRRRSKMLIVAIVCCSRSHLQEMKMERPVGGIRTNDFPDVQTDSNIL